MTRAQLLASMPASELAYWGAYLGMGAEDQVRGELQAKAVAGVKAQKARRAARR